MEIQAEGSRRERKSLFTEEGPVPLQATQDGAIRAELSHGVIVRRNPQPAAGLVRTDALHGQAGIGGS